MEGPARRVVRDVEMFLSWRVPEKADVNSAL